MAADNRQLFFVYGIHLDPQWLASCCRAPEVVGVARLQDYQLAFRGHSGCWDGGNEVLIRQPGAGTWGVLLALDQADGHRLDTDHGTRLDGTGTYFHYPVTVLDLEGREHEALTYMLNQQSKEALPSQEQLARIVEGARVRGCPQAYVTALAGHPAVPAGYPVPRVSGHRNLLDLQPSECSY